jgi:hypothetical protein
MVKKHTYEGTEDILKGRKPGLLVNFVQFPCFWIRIRIPNKNSGPVQPNP